MAFVWGGNTGEKLTPKEVERKRIAAALMQRQAGDTSPVASPFAGINRALQGFVSGRNEKRASAAETAGLASADERMAGVLAGLGGGGMTASTSGGSPGGTWTPAAPAPSLTDVPGASGGLSFGNAAPAMPQEGAGGLGFGAGPMTPQQMIIAGAEARGLDPIDVATAISYETGGTFDPVKRGPTTQWGQHQGLIQFGQPQAKQYGADFSNPQTAMNSQLDPETGAVWNYLDKTGVQPGMGLDNIYSAINAGAPGRMNASDANNGGAPGTVADKVAGMGAHREKAAAFLGGTWTPSEGGSNPVTVSTSGGQQQGGTDIASLLALSADPWVQEKYGPVIDALVGQQTRRDDATWQQQLAQSDPMYQAQLAELTAPKPVDPFANTKLVGDNLIGADGQGGFAPVYTAPADPGYVQLTPDEVAAKGLPPGAYQRGADGKISEIGGGGFTVNNDLGGGTNKQIFDAMDSRAQIAQSAYTALTALNEAEAAVDGGIISGAGANQILGFKKIATALGADPQAIVNTETFRAAMAPVVAATLKATAGTANLSNADMEFAKQAAGGDITLDSNSIKRLLGILRRGNEGVVKAYKARVDSVYPDGGGYDRERSIFGLGDIPVYGAPTDLPAPNDAPPNGVDPEDWKFMSPKEKALFQ